MTKMEKTNKKLSAPTAKGLGGAMRRAALMLLLAVFSVVSASAQAYPDGYSHTVYYTMKIVGEGDQSTSTHWNTGETALYFRNETGWQNNTQTQWGPVEYRYSTSFNKTNNDQSASFVFTPFESNYDPAINIAVSWNSPTTTFNLLQYHDWVYNYVSGSMQHDDYYITNEAGMFRGADKDAEWTVTIQSLDATKKIISVEFINKEGETKFSSPDIFTTTYTSPSLSNATMGETDNNDNRNGVHQIKVTFSDIPKAPWSGAGTEANPFIIHTVQDLKNLDDKVNCGTPYDGYYFAQDADIDCSGRSMVTIGYDRDSRFGGIYNGQNYAIRNYSDWTDNPIYKYPYRALFGNVSGTSAELKNIVLENCTITQPDEQQQYYIAGICAYPNNATISNCHVTGTLNGKDYTGGIVGYTANANVSNCFADVNITSTTGSNGYIYGYTTTHVTTSACYYRDNNNGIGGCGNSSISYSSSEIAPVYSVTTGTEGLTVAETNAAVTHNGTRYFVNGATATLNASGNYYIIGTPTVSGTGASLGKVASDRKSMTVKVGSGDVSVSATLKQISWSGDGSARFPYIIHTVSDLQDLATFVNTGIAFDGYYFEQDADINCSDYGMAPIGNLTNLFKGNYNGKNKKIINYHLDKPYPFSALFGPTEGATLTNIVMQDCNIDASSYDADYASAAGICISCTSGTTISNCRVTGTIKGRVVAGGIVGTISDANTISDCFADVTVTVVNADGKRGKIYGATSVHPTTSGCYYHDNGDGVGGCGYNESTAYSNSEIAPVYALTASNGLTLAETNVAVTHNGTRYFVSGANATLNVSDNNYSIVGTPTVSGTGATYTLAADRKSMTVTVGSADVTVTATLGTTQGSCGDNATWSMADNDNNGTFETLTISGTGAVQNYSQANPAPWGNAITIANVGDGITGIGDYAFASCSSLQRVNINNSGAVSIGSNTFSGCTALQYIVFPSIAAEQQNTTGNWEAYATKRRAQCGNQHFAVTTETGTAVYAIATEQDLRYLVYVGGASSGQTFRQTADITLDGSFSPIGGFSGTYDGGDKTISGLTISGDHQSAGLFGYVGSGVTVKNVRLISPSVTSSHSGGAWVAALIGNAQGCTVQNCLVVNPTVSATASSNDNRVGALFGSLSSGTAQNCFVINPTVSGTGTSYVGAICGYAHNGGFDYHCTLTNVYYYNSSLSAIGFNNNSMCASLTNVGRARKVTLGSGIASVSPDATEPANGFVYDNVSYYREGLALSLTDNLGIALDGYSKHYFANGTDLNGTTYTVSSTDGDATLIAAFRSDGQQHEVTYVDAQGESHTTNAILLDGYESTTTQYGTNYVDLYQGCYYVGTDITYTNTIRIKGNVTIILGNGKTMTSCGIEYNNDLTIYGQSLDNNTAGTLICQDCSSGIFNVNSYTQHSGNVSINCDSPAGSYGINANRVTLNGGKLTINVHGSNPNAIYASVDITINGGQLDATNSGWGNSIDLYAYSGNITLGWTNATDYIHATNYSARGTVSVKDGLVFVTNDDTPVTVSGTISDMSLINGKTLTPKLVGSGTTDDPYLITNAGGWDLFCDLVQNSIHTFQGNVKLGADISVRRMAGSASKPFAGHFDGQNHKLTFNYDNDNDDYVAPFRYVIGGLGAVTYHATISNLNVVSTINGSTHLAGLIANQKGLVDLTNCHVTATIISTATTASYCAGLVSHADLLESTDPNYYENENDGTLTISGCTVSGSISTYGKYTGGFVGMAEGKTSIVNSASSVTINSFVGDEGTHGGFIGLQQHTLNYANVKTTITGCLFNGKLITNNGTTNCGGFIGWHDGGSLEIKDCLYAPADIESGETEISDGCTFVGNGTVGDNCIYTRTLGTAQGKATHSIMAGDNVTIDNIALINFSSNPAVYNVSGITSYDWDGISCGDNLYICEGAHVSLVLSNDYSPAAPAGSVYGYIATAGTLEDNGNGTYTLTMPDNDVTINVDTQHTITLEWSGDGTESNPYIIMNKDQLDLLAYRMYHYGYKYGPDDDNEGHPNGYFFKLGADIVYPYTTDTENNFTPIGNGGMYPYPAFQGTFDGDGHTISGIRINYNDEYYENNEYYFSSFGLFGEISGTVKNVILADAIITGSYNVGGIAGYNNNGTLKNNLVIGSTISATYDNSHGVICGDNNGTLNHNYYTACTVGEVENAIGVGCGNIYDDEEEDYVAADITEDDGAVSALRDNADNTTAIALFAALPADLDLGWGAGKYPMQLAGRTLYKDGDWNTLCLPFSITADNISDSPLSDATYIMVLDTEGYYDNNGQLSASGTNQTGLVGSTLYLYFKTPVADSEGIVIPAGTPFIVKWGTPDSPAENLVNPVFSGVTVSSAAPTPVVFTGGSFVGQYSPFEITNANKDEIIMLGSGSTLGYSNVERTIANGKALRSFRAHFCLPVTKGGSRAMARYVVNFGEEEASGITTTNVTNDTNSADSWYTLDGRKLNGRPSRAGMYIRGGRKIVIK